MAFNYAIRIILCLPSPQCSRVSYLSFYGSKGCSRVPLYVASMCPFAKLTLVGKHISTPNNLYGITSEKCGYHEWRPFGTGPVTLLCHYCIHFNVTSQKETQVSVTVHRVWKLWPVIASLYKRTSVIQNKSTVSPEMLEIWYTMCEVTVQNVSNDRTVSTGLLRWTRDI